MDEKVLTAVGRVRDVLKTGSLEPHITAVQIMDHMARGGEGYSLGSIYGSINRLIVRGYLVIPAGSTSGGFVRTQKPC